MVIIHFCWTTCQKTPLLSSLNGDATVTIVPLKAFMQLVMPTIAGLMISQWTSLARPRSWMIPCFGITALRTPFWHTLEYIDLCAKNGIVFNPKKFKFALDEINFTGFNITPTGLRPSECLMDAIIHFPIPTNITDASLTRQHTLSPWLTRCYHSGTASRKMLSGTGTKIWRACSYNWRTLLLNKYAMVSRCFSWASLHAYPQIGINTA